MVSGGGRRRIKGHQQQLRVRCGFLEGQRWEVMMKNFGEPSSKRKDESQQKAKRSKNISPRARVLKQGQRLPLLIKVRWVPLLSPCEASCPLFRTSPVMVFAGGCENELVLSGCAAALDREFESVFESVSAPRWFVSPSLGGAGPSVLLVPVEPPLPRTGPRASQLAPR